MPPAAAPQPQPTTAPRPAPDATDSAAPPRPIAYPRLLSAVAINWLVPGAGYLVVGEKRRALLLFGLLHAFFILGLLLHGSVILPEFNYRSSTFNIINVLTFLVQLGAGGPALLCVAARPLAGLPLSLVSPTQSATALPGGLLGFLVGDPAAATYDLAAFHILLVGALNYFACCALYDRFHRRSGDATRPRPTEAHP